MKQNISRGETEVVSGGTTREYILLQAECESLQLRLDPLLEQNTKLIALQDTFTLENESLQEEIDALKHHHSLKIAELAAAHETRHVEHAHEVVKLKEEKTSWFKRLKLKVASGAHDGSFGENRVGDEKVTDLTDALEAARKQYKEELEALSSYF